jgi:hypothetical protein
MNAPDRIFAEEPDVFDGMGLWHSEGPYAEYIRADLHDTALAAAKAEGIREGMLKAADMVQPSVPACECIDCAKAEMYAAAIREAAGEP